MLMKSAPDLSTENILALTTVKERWILLLAIILTSDLKLVCPTIQNCSYGLTQITSLMRLLHQLNHIQISEITFNLLDSCTFPCQYRSNHIKAIHANTHLHSLHLSLKAPFSLSLCYSTMPQHPCTWTWEYRLSRTAGRALTAFLLNLILPLGGVASAISPIHKNTLLFQLSMQHWWNMSCFWGSV